MVIVRDRLRQDPRLLEDYSTKFVRLDAVINYRDKKSNSALIGAAKGGHIDSFKLLFDLGANLYVTNSKLNNVLHFAIMSEKE